MGARYKAVYRDGKLFAEYEHGELTYLDPAYQAPKRSEHAMPMVMRDMDEYRSPLDGTVVSGRRAHRDHMRVHGVVEVGNEKIGNMHAATANAEAKVDRELGETIKRRVEEVRALPQASYDEHVQKQAYEHAEVASLITATE